MELTAPKLVVFDKYISTPVQEPDVIGKAPSSEPKPISGTPKTSNQNMATSSGSTPISIPSSNNNKTSNNMNIDSAKSGKHEIYGATPPFSNFGSLEKSSPMISASPLSPPFAKEYIDQLSSSFKNKQFKFPFSPYNDAPIQQKAYSSNSMDQSSASVGKDANVATAPSVQQQNHQATSQQDEIIEEDQPFQNPADCVPGFLQDDDNLLTSSGGLAANQMMQAADIEDVCYIFLCEPKPTFFLCITTGGLWIRSSRCK